MAQIQEHELLPASTQDAIREFNLRYAAARAEAKPSGWAQEFGDVFDTGSPLVRFPMGSVGGRYEEDRGENVTETLKDRYADMTFGSFRTGHEANAIDLVTNPMIAKMWDETPARFILREANFVQRKVAEMIEANPACGWDGLALFHAAHLSNPNVATSPTFGNLQTTPKACTLANIEVEAGLMSDVIDVNGEPLDVVPTHVIPARGVFLKVKNEVGKEFLANGESNSWFGNIEVGKWAQLSDINDWYLVDMNLIKLLGLMFFAAVRYVPTAKEPGTNGGLIDPSGLINYGPESDYFKDHERVKIISRIRYGFAALFPHAVRKVVGA